MSTQKVSDAMIADMAASKLSGALPALDGSALTGLLDSAPTKNASDPAIDTNPSGGLGTLWLNTTSGELFMLTDATTDENVWTNVGAGTGDVRLNNLGNRGIWAGGVSSYTDQINYISIPTTGNATDFGNLLATTYSSATASSGSRMLISGGVVSGGQTDTIQYVTFATPGNATDFGDLLLAHHYCKGGSDGSRAVLGSGYTSVANRVTDISYLTIATPGNATDFGDLTVARATTACHASLERALWSNGYNGSSRTNVIDYVTIATPGNAVDFGDTTVGVDAPGSMGNTTRALFVGGVLGPGSVTNTVNYVTMATPGNATDFGDLSGTAYDGEGTGNDTRGVYGLGLCWSCGTSRVNTLDYFTFATPGNATDFGDLEYASDGWCSSSGD
jgi:hypothetical protein